MSSDKLFEKETVIEVKPSYRYLVRPSKTEENQALVRLIKKEVAWEQESLRMFGRDVLVPRQVGFIGDAGLCYRYTGKDHFGEGWPIWLIPIKEEAERLAGQAFNSVLLNWYQHGEDYMGWHADNEKVLGPAPVIAMLSLGAKRDFLFRFKKSHTVKHKMVLDSGSWLIMEASTQALWQHCLPKRKRVREERISLTFRQLLG